MNADELKKADEIVRALRATSDANPEHRHGKLCNQAADLIDSLTSQLADQTARANICEHDAAAWREDRDRLYEQLAKYKNTGLTPDEVQTGFNDHMDIAVGRAIDAKEENLRLRAELEVSRRREKAAVEQAILWGTSLIEANTDAHVTFCAECGFPIADYGVDKEIFCSMCKSKNSSHNYVVTGPGSCKTTATRKAKTYDRLFGRGPQEAGKGEAE